MSLDVFQRLGLASLVRRAGGEPHFCGFAILAGVEHDREVGEIVAQYLATDPARLYLLWLLPYPQTENELTAIQAIARVPYDPLRRLLCWPPLPFGYELGPEDFPAGMCS